MNINSSFSSATFSNFSSQLKTKINSMNQRNACISHSCTKKRSVFSATQILVSKIVNHMKNLKESLDGEEVLTLYFLTVFTRMDDLSSSDLYVF